MSLPGEPNSSPGVPSSENIVIGDWSLNYEITSSDGLRIYDGDYKTQRIFTSIKLVEWHSDFGNSGYLFSTGSASSGGGFPIYPYGPTQILDLLDAQSRVIGFEIVQDFRMNNWGLICNDRFEQRIQFFENGQFRVVSGAYGQGCGTNSIYRPVVRIDIAISGDGEDSFWTWDGSHWIIQTTEDWWMQPAVMNPGNYPWLIKDSAGSAFFVEPGAGQFGDGGRGDDAWIYVTLHHLDEGDSDLSIIGSCCNDDYQQGPDQFLNGESIGDANLVLWYVPQMAADASADDGDERYCWTEQGEPDPETYPCFSGPMFLPVHTVFLPVMLR